MARELSEQGKIEQDAERARMLEVLARLKYEAESVLDSTDNDFAAALDKLLDTWEKRWEIVTLEGWTFPHFGSEEWNR